MGALTFSEELWKAVVSAAATAVFVTVAAGFAIGWLTKKSESRKHEYALRSELLERCSRTAAEMFMTCQETSRAIRNDDPGATTTSLDTLDVAYHTFQIEQQVLENELGSRFGFRQIPTESGPGNDAPSDYVAGRWHQIADLLTMYCFNLKDHFPGDVRNSNSRGYNGGYHSGIDFNAYDVPKEPGKERRDSLRTMRNDIRGEYRHALNDLVQSILAARFQNAA